MVWATLCKNTVQRTISLVNCFLIKVLEAPVHSFLIICWGPVWTRRQIMWSRSCVGCLSGKFVRACTENLVNRFWCKFYYCSLLWSSCANLSMENNFPNEVWLHLYISLTCLSTTYLDNATQFVFCFAFLIRLQFTLQTKGENETLCWHTSRSQL